MADEKALMPIKDIKISSLIHAIRKKQVMIDSDLANIYQVETKVFNQAVKRNIKRFPEYFRFQLTDEEFNYLRSQIVTSSSEDNHGGRRYNPYAFTEQGIAMLSSVLKSDIAIDVSIKIMDTFVESRKFLINNKELFSRLDRVEIKQLDTDKKLEEVFNYIATQYEVKQKIFFNGQIYDAFSFIVGLINKAQNSLTLIDNYVDVNTLNLLCKKNMGVNVVIATASKGNLSAKDVQNFNEQYPKLSIKITNDFHDRFLIVDSMEVYHIGASIKDAGKKSFGITKIEDKDLIKGLIDKVH